METAHFPRPTRNAISGRRPRMGVYRRRTSLDFLVAACLSTVRVGGARYQPMWNSVSRRWISARSRTVTVPSVWPSATWRPSGLKTPPRYPEPGCELRPVMPFLHQPERPAEVVGMGKPPGCARPEDVWDPESM